MWRLLLAVSLGGALGACLRFGLGEVFAQVARSKHVEGELPEALLFPWATLVANVTGSFLLASFVEWLRLSKLQLSTEFNVFFTIGVCGSFTTYSTFNFDLLRLIEDGKVGRATLYIGATLLTALLAGCLGLVLARFLVDR